MSPALGDPLEHLESAANGQIGDVPQLQTESDIGAVLPETRHDFVVAEPRPGFSQQTLARHKGLDHPCEEIFGLLHHVFTFHK